MRQLLLARHGESEFSAKALVNGDPRVAGGLTPAGREQAAALGEALGGQSIDLVAVTEFERVRETAELALAGRALPTIVLPELNDPRYGDFEGGPLDDYLAWAWANGPLDLPPGGEHRAEIAARYAAGFAKLLERPERTVLLVAHSLPLRYVLDAAEGRAPGERAGQIEYTTLHRLSREQLARAVQVLGSWAAAPVFQPQ